MNSKRQVLYQDS